MTGERVAGEAEQSVTVGLIIRVAPYLQRSARSQLDVALVLAAMECRLRLYFLGSAVLQLLSERDLRDAGLPAGYRAWASLPELTEAAFFAETVFQSHLTGSSGTQSVSIEPTWLERTAMRQHWESCQRLMVLQS